MTTPRTAQDQTARASEAKLLESELARAKDEISTLKQQLVESQQVEKERKKLADKVERLEGRVRPLSLSLFLLGPLRLGRLTVDAPSQQMDDLIQDKVANKEAELHATYDERLRNYDERCVLPFALFCFLLLAR